MPVVVLGAQEKVDGQNGDRGGRDDHQPVTHEQKSKHVVDLGKPDAAHDEVQLDEDGAKG